MTIGTLQTGDSLTVSTPLAAEILLWVTSLLLWRGDLNGLARPFCSKAHSSRCVCVARFNVLTDAWNLSCWACGLSLRAFCFRAEYGLLWCGFFAILFLGLEGGIAAGVVLSALYFATAYARVRLSIGQCPHADCYLLMLAVINVMCAIRPTCSPSK